MASQFNLIAAGLLLLVSIVCGQSAKKYWTAEEFYDPQTKARDCGFPNNYPAYICDPNGILGGDLKAINWILADAAHNSTKCPCSQYHCETTKFAKGYKIGVALVQSMKIERDADGQLLSPEDQAQKFAYQLKSMKWRMGNCEEDIIIFYSKKDKILSIFTGRTAGMKLTPYYRDLLAFKIGSRLNDGRIVEALNVLLYDMKIILNCDAATTSDCSLYESTTGSASQSTASLALTMLTTALFLFISRH